MSIVSALQNSNQIITSTAVSTVTAVGAAAVYVALPDWPAVAQVDRIIVTSDEAFTNLNVTVLSDGAAYRGGSADTQPPYIEATAADAGSAQQKAIFTFNPPAQVENRHGVNVLYVLITGTITTGTTFRVRAEGRKRLSEKGDMSVGRLDRSYRVLRVPSSGATIDLTQEAMRNGNPYGLGGIDTSLNFTALNVTSDKLYVGSEKRITSLFFMIPSYSMRPAGTALTAQLWDGSTWATATILDNTSDGQTSAAGFCYTGVVVIPDQTWIPTQVAADPLKILEDNVKTGLVHPQTFLYNPDRYWIRFSMTLSTPVKMVGLIPLN